MKKLLFLIALITTLTVGCNLAAIKQAQLPINQISTPKETIVDFLVSPDDYTKYCNGADMDSEGYKKSITKRVTKTLVGTNLSQTELVNKTIVLASEETNLTSVVSMDQDFIRIINDTAYIKPIDGWAGVSIFLCAWQPLVETNIFYLTNIKNVVWLQDLQKWQDLTK